MTFRKPGQGLIKFHLQLIDPSNHDVAFRMFFSQSPLKAAKDGFELILMNDGKFFFKESYTHNSTKIKSYEFHEARFQYPNMTAYDRSYWVILDNGKLFMGTGDSVLTLARL